MQFSTHPIARASALLLGLVLGSSAWAALPPTNEEQYLLELINRARADPTAEATRLGIALNEGLAPGTISTAAKPALAFNTALIQAARDYSGLMDSTNTFSHTAGGTNAAGRALAAGYASWSGENIAANTSSPPMTAAIAESLHNQLFIDAGVAGRGHRTNILSESAREIGLGLLSSTTSSIFGPGFPNVALLTEDFGNDGVSTFLTGVVYNDTLLANSFYTPGEGLGGIVVGAFLPGTLTQVASTTTFGSGGYSLALAPGNYDIRFADGGGNVFLQTVNWSTATNLKLDAINPVFAGGVPEPSTWLLLLAGAAVLGLRAQRLGAGRRAG